MPKYDPYGLWLIHIWHSWDPCHNNEYWLRVSNYPRREPGALSGIAAALEPVVTFAPMFRPAAEVTRRVASAFAAHCGARNTKDVMIGLYNTNQEIDCVVLDCDQKLVKIPSHWALGKLEPPVELTFTEFVYRYCGRYCSG